jgi:hypothetical protein
MTIEVRGKAPNFNGHIVRLALHLWGLPQNKLVTHQPQCVVFRNNQLSFANFFKSRRSAQFDVIAVLDTKIFEVNHVCAD